jgi:hypothetical protein
MRHACFLDLILIRIQGIGFFLVVLSHDTFLGTDNVIMIGLALILCHQLSLISTQDPTYKYSTANNSQVQNIIYDDSNRRIFVGGTNQILRLSVSVKVLISSWSYKEKDCLT